MDTSQSGIVSTMGTDAPASQSVGTYYDHQIFDLMAQLGDGNLHYGYWLGEDDSSSFEEAMEQMTEQMIRRLRPKSGDRILDVGCGNGTPAFRLAARCDVEVVGISVSERQVARANERARREGVADRVRFELVDAMDLPFQEGSFNGAWAIESMFHMPDKVQVMSGVARVLTPGSRFPVADLVHRSSAAEQPQQGSAGYSSVYAALTDLGDYASTVEKAGLVPLEVTDVTVHTSRSVTGFADWMRSQRERYVEMFGESGFEILVANQEAMASMPEIGYAMITAERP